MHDSYSDFLVGAFLVKSVRLLQWFRQTTDLIVYVPLFSTDFNRFTGTQRSRVRVPKKRIPVKRIEVIAKGPLSIFFGAMRTFFEAFFVSEGSPPLSSFLKSLLVTFE